MRRSASRASDSKRIPGLHHWRTLGSRWRAPRPDASTRPSARRCAASVCDARRSPPSVTPTRCSCSRRSALARSRLERATIVLERAQREIAEFPDPGRLPAIAATVEQDLITARANAGNGHVVEQPTAAELAVLRCLAAGLSRREIGARLYISLNTVKTHIRELYRKLGASSRADAVARAEALGLLELTRITRVILRPSRPKLRPSSGMLRLVCRRLATGSSSKENWDHATRPRSTG